MLDLPFFNALNSDQKIKLRGIICDLHYEELDEKIELPLDDFQNGELDGEDQQESDKIMINFFNERYTSVEDCIIKNNILYLKEEEKPSRDEVTGSIQRECAQWMEIFPELDTKTVENEIFTFFESLPLPLLKEAHDGIDRSVFIDDESAEQAFFELIIPELLKDQPNIYLRLQDDGFSNAEEVDKLLEEVLKNYDNTNKEHRLVVAELLSDFLQTGASFESVIAKKIFADFLKKNPNPQSRLAKLKIPKDNIETILKLGRFDKAAMTKEAAATIHNVDDNIVTPPPENPSGFLKLSYINRDPILESFYTEEDGSLLKLIKELQKRNNTQDAVLETVHLHAEDAIEKTSTDIRTLVEDMGLLADDDFDMIEEFEANESEIFSNKLLDNIQILINKGLIDKKDLNRAIILEIAVYEHFKEKEREKPKENIFSFKRK